MSRNHAFTLKNKGLLRELMTPCGISLAFMPDPKIPQKQHPSIKEYKAIWDTGATGCVISERVINDLGLKPVGRRRVFTPSTPQAIIVNEYLINIFLPNQVAVPVVRATEGTLSNFDVLIGMDIISMGDFAVSHKNGGTTFSFQMPSTHDFDFYKESETEAHTPVTKEAKPGRNAPCPCGSGKKYKHCHGKTR